jgi:hypothetical protein
VLRIASRSSPEARKAMPRIIAIVENDLIVSYFLPSTGNRP